MVKAGGEDRVRNELPSVLSDAIAAVAPEMSARESPLWQQLQRAATQGSKMLSGKALKVVTEEVE